MQRFFKIIPAFLSLLSWTQQVTAQEIRQQGKRGFITFAPRIGVGIHNGFVLEGGLSALLIDLENLEFNALSLYTTYFTQQRNFQSGFDVQGFKVGLQSSWGIFMGGLEVKTAYYKGHSFTYISPKIGLSFVDVVNVEYLINIAGTNDNFPMPSKHQVGINISLNKVIYNKVWGPWSSNSGQQSIQ